MTTYAEVISYLYQLLPVFHRDGKAAYKPGLDTIRNFCQRLGDPQDQIRTIHVAGTNGKGSSSHGLAAILQSAGYRVGLYTSPHLKDFRERIKVDGIEIPENFVVDFVSLHRTYIEGTHPSFFEVSVAMAFHYFKEMKVDVAVIEVGVGGRLDSTNIIHPEVSLITNIGWDHTDLLGDTLQQIAFEKAGIIKSKTPVVISEKQREVSAVFEEQAKLNEAPLFYASDWWQIKEEGIDQHLRRVTCLEVQTGVVHHYSLGLLGLYQLNNLKGILQTVQCLRQIGWAIPVQAVAAGLRELVLLTGLKGRWQQIRERPRIYCDTAHNESGIKEVLATIQSIAHDRLWIGIGVVRDKDLERIFSVLPDTAHYISCQATNPRALPASELSDRLTAAGLANTCIPDVNVALCYILDHASPNDLGVITGSTYLIADIKE